MLLEQLGALIKILTHDNASYSCIDIYKLLINKVLTVLVEFKLNLIKEMVIKNHILFIDNRLLRIEEKKEKNTTIRNLRIKHFFNDFTLPN